MRNLIEEKVIENIKRGLYNLAYHLNPAFDVKEEECVTPEGYMKSRLDKDVEERLIKAVKECSDKELLASFEDQLCDKYR